MKQITATTAFACLGAALNLLTSGASAQSVLADDFGSHLLGSDDGAITPDGRYGIIRDNTALTTANFYDMTTGAPILGVQSTLGSISGTAQDAVVCNDSRAAVLGSSLMIFDLNLLPANPLLSETNVGFRPRDLEMTPDGTLLVVRGGHPLAGGGGGLSVFDLATGAQLANAPGNPQIYGSDRHSFDVDSVVTSNTHAVCTSAVYLENVAFTRVTIWELRPAGGGPPQVVYETRRDNGTDQEGGPHDLALNADGTFCAVRSEIGVGCYLLASTNSTQLWKSPLAGNPGPFGDSALDSIEVNNTRIATISRQSNPMFPLGAQVDVFDVAGNHGFDRVLGDPHDLALDESGQNLVVRTHSRLYHYDLNAWSSGATLVAQSSVSPAVSTSTSFGAGLDSVLIHGTRVVSLFRVSSTTEVFVHDFGSGTLQQIGQHTMNDTPIDLAITPSGKRCVVSGTSGVDVVDMNTGDATLTHQVVPTGWWPWCDGVVVNDERALAFGIGNPNISGWVSILDLFDEPTNYCVNNPNSASAGAEIYANGSASIGTNDLTLVAAGLPVAEFTQFFYGPLAQQVPFGNGFLCVGGQLGRFPLTTSFGAGVAIENVDYNNLPAAGGAISAGSTWRFQAVYRDLAACCAQFNTTDGLEIVFGI